MAALRLPALAPDRLLLDRLEDVLPTLAWTIHTGELAPPDVPPVPMLPWQLGDFLLATTTSYQVRDQVWAAVVTRSRRPDPAGTGWRLVALGLAVAGLRGFRRRIHVASTHELPDVHADLVEGFLTRLGTIDTSRPNIAGRLIGSAIGRAARRHRDHLDRPRPAELAHQPRPARRDPGSTEICLYRSAARLAETGPPLDPVDVELVALTRLDGHSLVEAADLFTLPLERAYKRRQRAEQRLSDLLRSQPDDTNRPTRPQAAVSGATAGATASGASAEPATRQTAVPRERR